MDKKKIEMIVEEAARILKENPQLKYRQAIQKAKEVVLSGYPGTVEGSGNRVSGSTMQVQ